MEKEKGSKTKPSGSMRTRRHTVKTEDARIYMERLKESEEKYRALVNDASDVLILADLDGRILEVNKKAEQLLGYTKEELLAMKIWALHAPEDYPFITEGFRRLEKEGSDRWLDGGILRKDGRRIPIDLSSSKVTYNGRKAYQALIRDITERKTLEEELRRSRELYRCVVEDQNDLVCRYSPEGTLTFVNDAYCRYFKKSREELLGSSFLPLIPQEDHLVVKKTLALLSPSSPVVTHEHRVISPEGIQWMEWSNRILCDEQGGSVIYQAVGREITQRKELEKQQRKRKDELEREVRIRTAQLREEAERLSLEI